MAGAREAKTEEVRQVWSFVAVLFMVSVDYNEVVHHAF